MSRHLELAEAGWRWVLDQVRWDELGPWIPTAVGPGPVGDPPQDRDGMHSGIGGLVHALAAIAPVRPWTPVESELAAAVGERLRARTSGLRDASWFDGLVSDLGVLALLGGAGVDACVDELLRLEPADWGFHNDATLGTGGLVLAGLTAHAAGSARGLELTAYAADLLLAEAEETPAGLNWLFVPRRHVPSDALDGGRPVEMPNWSHGVAGVAAVLARAGTALERSDLVEAAQLGASHYLSLAVKPLLMDGALVVPRRIPAKPGEDACTWNWCHGPAGALGLFEALEDAGVASVAGESPAHWVDCCVHALRTSGIPERLRPGFWDNDGRCCGTAGAGSAVLPYDRSFATTLADALVDRAVPSGVDGDRACWRFVEHRAAEPLLPPGVGWMQGAAGIAGFLFELSA